MHLRIQLHITHCVPSRWIITSSLVNITILVHSYDVGVISGSLSDMGKSLHMSVLEREAITSGLSFVAAIGAVR